MPNMIGAMTRHAVRLHDGYGASLPAEKIFARARRLAMELTHNGAACVGLRLDNGVEWICTDIACLLARIPLVPIPLFFSESQVRHVVESTGMNALVGVIDGAEDAFRGFDAVDGEFRLWTGPAGPCPIPSGTAKVSFTSGTTGTPRGVCISRSQQERVARELARRTHELALRKHLTVLPLAVLLENVAGVYGAFVSGSDVAVPPLSWVGVRGSSGFDPGTLLEAVRTFQPDSMILLPQMLKDLVELLESGAGPVRGLKFVAVGGARTAPDLIHRARALGLPVYEGYGLTEASSVVSLNLPGADRPGSVGRALFPDSLRVNEHDEIEVFLPGGLHCLGAPPRAAGWLATGDLGEIDDQGYVHVKGRSKQVLVTAFGRNVSPEWLESELLAEPSIAQAMVMGDDQPAIGALLVPAHNAAPSDIEQAVVRCNARVPDYARIAAWRCIPPLRPEDGLSTANGRTRRAQVHAAHADLIAALLSDIEKATRRISMDFHQQLARDTQAERRGLLTQPVISECLAGRISAETYLGFLEQAYHHVRHTVPLLMACGARLPQRLDWLREAVAEYIEEETGHEKWILNDIEACGGNAEQVRSGKPAVATDVMVAYAWDCVLRRNPVGFFGMVFVLEGTSVELASAAADVIQEQLGLPDRAFSYLRSHGELDREHIEFFNALINRLDEEQDREAVVDTARVMYRLYAQVFAALPGADRKREAA